MITEQGRQSLELIDKDIARWTNKKLLEWVQDIDRDSEYDIQLEARLIVELGKRNITVRR
mgnify:CR=1 FL=1|tara:strand:+ start:438 stop:617 length:180 start_codon:yes stop_codon:yes gene_type:complete